MTLFGRLALACALTLTATGVGWAQSAPAPPGMGGIVWRVVGALAVVGALLTVTLAMLRGLTGGRGRPPASFARGRLRSWLARWQRRRDPRPPTASRSSTGGPSAPRNRCVSCARVASSS